MDDGKVEGSIERAAVLLGMMMLAAIGFAFELQGCRSDADQCMRWADGAAFDPVDADERRRREAFCAERAASDGDG